MSAAPILRLKDVTVRASGRALLERVTLDLFPGDLGMLIGPNGAGKSTLLRAVLGLTNVDEGTITIEGISHHARESRTHIGFVPQTFPIDRSFPMTVEEFLRDYATTRAGLPGAKPLAPDAPLRMAKRLGLGEKLRRPIGILSGGETQRLLLAAAFLDEPRLILLDEPLAGIDMQGEGDFHEIVAEYRSDHPDAAFMIVSHDIGVVYRHASRVFCLNRVLHAEGAPSEALNQETFEKLYGMSHFPGAHHHHVH